MKMGSKDAFARQLFLKIAEYQDKLIVFKDRQLIKVVTGARRCGKSTLVEIYQNWLLEHGTEREQIISINFEDIPACCGFP